MSFWNKSGWVNACITLLVLVLGVASSFALFGHRLNEVEKKIDRVESVVEQHSAYLYTSSERLEWIVGSLVRIEGSLDTFVTKETCGIRHSN